MFRKIIVLLICFCFICEQSGVAQIAPQPVTPAYLSGLPAVIDRFRPVQMRSIEYSGKDDGFKLLLDKGTADDLTREKLEQTSKQLFEYFQTGLALPNSMFWVNLRTDSTDNIIDP